MGSPKGVWVARAPADRHPLHAKSPPPRPVATAPEKSGKWGSTGDGQWVASRWGVGRPPVRRRPYRPVWGVGV